MNSKHLPFRRINLFVVSTAMLLLVSCGQQSSEIDEATQVDAGKADTVADEGDEILTVRLKVGNAMADAMEAGDVQEVGRLVEEELIVGRRWAAYCEKTSESERRKLLSKYRDEQIALHERTEKAKPAYLRAAGVQPESAVP